MYVDTPKNSTNTLLNDLVMILNVPLTLLNVPSMLLTIPSTFLHVPSMVLQIPQTLNDAPLLNKVSKMTKKGKSSQDHFKGTYLPAMA